MASKLYRQACENGSSNGCQHIAYMYYHGKGVDKDRSLSKKYYNKACKMGNKQSCNFLKKYKKEF